VVRFNTDKIRSKGWKNNFTAYEAIKESISSIYEDAKLNKFEWKGAAVV